jgi:HAD superfamily hydrolase (TIGR01509 family)
MTSPPSPHALVFDMDGTLLDSHGAVLAAFAGVLATIGAPDRPRGEIAGALVAGPAPAILSRLLERPATSEEVAEYHGRLAHLAEGVEVYAGVAAALEALAVPIALFTGATVRSAEILLGAAGLARHFDVVVGGDLVERPKPAPDGLLEAARRLRVPPAELAYVGDSPLDLRCAWAAGATAVAAGWGELFDPSAAADVVLRRPADLLGLVR